MTAPRIITSLYALLIFIGGCIGYYKAHSTPSIVIAAIASLLLLFFAFQMKPKNKYAIYGALIIIAILDAFFTYRFVNGQKFFPSGMMSLISLITLFAFILTMKKGK